VGGVPHAGDPLGARPLPPDPGSATRRQSRGGPRTQSGWVAR
jgi:hypothetical protein